MPRKPQEQIVCEYFTFNLFQRDRVYYADGRHNDPNLGKHSLGTRDRDEALANLRQLDRRMAVDRKLLDPQAISATALSIAAGWERYLAHCRRPLVLNGVSKKTSQRYTAVRDKHLVFCNQRRINDWQKIDKHSIEPYAACLKKGGYADASVYLECMLLKQIVKWLIEEEKVLPAAQRIILKLCRAQESSTYCWSPVQVQAMLDLCRREPKLAWLGNVVVALASTGLRIDELVKLRWSDIDLAARMIHIPDTRHSGQAAKLHAVRTTKGGYGRRMPIHPTLLPVLEELPRRPDGRVFGGAGGGVLKADKIRNALVKKVLAVLKQQFTTSPGAIGFEHGRLHSFRHYFVSQAFLGGASEGEIREWVGHRDSRIVERYRHLHSDEAQRKMAQLHFVDGGSHGQPVAGQAAHAANTAGGKTANNTNTTDNTDNDCGNKKNRNDDSNRAAVHPDVPEARQGIKESEVPATKSQPDEIRGDGQATGGQAGVRPSERLSDWDK